MASTSLHPFLRPLWPAAETLALVAVGALCARYAERWFDPRSLALFFVVPIVLVAIRRGLWLSFAASLLSTAALNYLFVEPRYTLAIARAQDAAALALFALVGGLASAVAARAREAAMNAERRAREAQLLQALATRLSVSAGDDEIAQAALQALSQLANAPTALIAADERRWGAVVGDIERDSARWAMSTKLPFSDAEWSFWPIIFGGRSVFGLGVRAVNLRPDLAACIEQVAAQVGLAMERARVARAEEAARLEAARERFKSELLAGVSHDLRTPLSTIVFTLQSLQRFAADHSPDAHAELLTLAEKEARRLSELVEALLDASRIGKGGAPVRLEACAVRDLVTRACAAAGAENTSISVNVPTDLPPVMADADLAVRAIGNVIANATRHGGAQIVISAARDGDGVAVRVQDNGPGLGDDPERWFERFARRDAGDGRAPGLGLGLSLARSFLESQGGRITACNAAAGGAEFAITLRCAAAKLTHVS